MKDTIDYLKAIILMIIVLILIDFYVAGNTTILCDMDKSHEMRSIKCWASNE